MVSVALIFRKNDRLVLHTLNCYPKSFTDVTHSNSVMNAKFVPSFALLAGITEILPPFFDTVSDAQPVDCGFCRNDGN